MLSYIYPWFHITKFSELFGYFNNPQPLIVFLILLMCRAPPPSHIGEIEISALISLNFFQKQIAFSNLEKKNSTCYTRTHLKYK